MVPAEVTGRANADRLPYILKPPRYHTRDYSRHIDGSESPCVLQRLINSIKN